MNIKDVEKSLNLQVDHVYTIYHDDEKELKYKIMDLCFKWFNRGIATGFLQEKERVHNMK